MNTPNDLLEKFRLAKVRVEDVSIHIFQPRASKEENYQPKAVDLKAQALINDYLPIIMERIAVYEKWVSDEEIPQEDYQKYQKVGSWCQFCVAKPLCKPFNEKKMGSTIQLFKKALEVKTKAESLTTKEIAKVKFEQKDVNLMLSKGVVSEEEFEFIALNASAIKAFVDLFRPIAIQLLGKGKKYKNMKLIEINGDREFIPDTKKLIKGLKALGIDNPVKIVEKFMTISDVEKTIGKGKIEHLVIQGDKRSKIVEIDHEAPSITFGIQKKALFKDALLKKKEKSME